MQCSLIMKGCPTPNLTCACRGVLGDRRRVSGQWAGSVLDSVMGVFLTQNVSDALSSKAWMTLAATFPLAAADNQHQVMLVPDLPVACPRIHL